MFLRRICLSSETAALFALLMIIEDSEYPLLLLTAALIHEIGHMTSALIFGASFKFGGAGIAGVSIEYSCLTLSYQKELVIALSGAMSNILVAVIFGILNKIYFQNLLLTFFIMCNFILGLMNILPIKAFDGGTILKCILLLIFTEETAEKIYNTVISISSVILWFFAVYIQLILGGNLSLLIISIYVLLESFSL